MASQAAKVNALNWIAVNEISPAITNPTLAH
jgi:hypothetical protein